MLSQNQLRIEHTGFLVLCRHKPLEAPGEVFETSPVQDPLHRLVGHTPNLWESLLAEICSSFISLYKNKKNIKEVTVTTALPLDDSMRKELMNYVGAQNNTNIELIEKVDESLIGGAIIRMGDTQLDASVSSKLKALRQKFSENLYIENY